MISSHSSHLHNSGIGIYALLITLAFRCDTWAEVWRDVSVVTKLTQRHEATRMSGTRYTTICDFSRDHHLWWNQHFHDGNAADENSNHHSLILQAKQRHSGRVERSVTTVCPHILPPARTSLLSSLILSSSQVYLYDTFHNFKQQHFRAYLPSQYVGTYLAGRK